MGGKPSKGTRRDKRLKSNKVKTPKATRKGKSAKRFPWER